MLNLSVASVKFERRNCKTKAAPSVKRHRHIQIQAGLEFCMINTREIAAEYRLEHWAGIVRKRIESGLTVKAFCESAGMHPNSYFYWQHKLRESALEGITAGALPAPRGWTTAVPSGSAGNSRTLPIEIGRCRVIVDSDTDERLLAKVCRVLASL
jgi:transposase-like protein